jgi:hypothetical protein
MMRSVVRVVLLALAFALGTLVIGWFALPIVAVAWGAIADRERASLDAVVAAAVAWGALLVLAMFTGAIGEVARVIGGVVGVPSWVPIVATLLFGVALAWSAAVVGREIARVVRAARVRAPSPATPRER